MTNAPNEQDAKNAYLELAEHLSRLGMAYPKKDTLLDMLKANFSPLEAKVALAIPNRGIPLETFSVDEIAETIDIPIDDLRNILEELSKKGLLFSSSMEDEQTGYALHQIGFGFPQTFFWKGEDTPHARKMAVLTAKYFNRHVTAEVYDSDTKPYRYIPVNQSIPAGKQTVYPYHLMEEVIEQAEIIAVGHCPCRMGYALAGRGCDHPTEVCLKFNDLARYVIERGFARQITHDQAREIIKKAEESGLVHFVDNTEGDIQHNCNCCGCACWNVGNIRRRKIPRDALMATYFIRETDNDTCIQCGECVDICPVDAMKLEEGSLILDDEWCIGCGVCTTVCSADAIKMKLRPDRTEKLPAANFKALYQTIIKEKSEKVIE